MAGFYHFGDFTLDPQARELRRSGELLSVSPKLFDCIAYLIEHRERAVGRDELIAAVWGRVDVADVQLRHLVRKVRHALGDNGDDQTIIRTLPGFGFRWVAQEHGTEAPETQSPVADSMPRSGRDTMRMALRISLALALVAATGLGLWIVASHRLHVTRPDTTEAAAARASTPVARDRKLIAVLPVGLVNAGADSGWMSLGLMDLIAGRLREARLAVVPSSDMVKLAHNGHPPVDTRVRSATGAGALVTPSLTHQTDQWVMRLSLDKGDEMPQVIEGRSPDAILAAQEAAGRLLAVLGKTTQTSTADIPRESELKQRIEAALLVDDFATARRLIESAPASLRDLPELQLDAARVDIGAGRYVPARERLEKLLAKTPAETAPVLRARIFNHLGGVTFHLDGPDLAIREFGASLALLENRDEPVLAGQAYARRGGIFVTVGRYDDAAADFARARTAFAMTGNTLDLAVVELNEGTLEAMRKHPSQAIALYERVIRDSEPFGSRVNLLHALGNEISAYLDLLQPAMALAASERVDREFAGAQLTPDLRLIRYQQIAALLKSGHLNVARQRVDKLEHEIVPAKEKQTLGLLLGYRAQIDLLTGHPDAAADHAAAAVRDLSPRDDSGMRSFLWLTWTRALRAAHRTAEAADATRKFGQWLNGRSDDLSIVHSALAAAEQAIAEGRTPDAWPLFERALDAARREDVPGDIADVAVSYGNALIGANELPRAGTIVGQVARWAGSDFDCAALQARYYHALGRGAAWNDAIRQAQGLAGERVLSSSVLTPPRPAVAVAEGP
jgi:DNA-binding winged helix-turn-helix (wHTH) protein/tetratricopeptide (TPR) repeat protein